MDTKWFTQATCRICLTDKENVSQLMSYPDHFLNIILNNEYLKGLNTVCLPDKICTECIKEFEALRKFIDKCEKSNALLQEHYQNNYVTEQSSASLAIISKTNEGLLKSSGSEIRVIDTEDIGSAFNVKLQKYSKFKSPKNIKKSQSKHQISKKLKYPTSVGNESKIFVSKFKARLLINSECEKLMNQLSVSDENRISKNIGNNFNMFDSDEYSFGNSSNFFVKEIEKS